MQELMRAGQEFGHYLEYIQTQTLLYQIIQQQHQKYHTEQFLGLAIRIRVIGAHGTQMVLLYLPMIING